MKRRVLAWVTAAAMLFTSVPGNALTAYAQETEESLVMEAQEQEVPVLEDEQAAEPVSDEEGALVSEQPEEELAVLPVGDASEDILISEDVEEDMGEGIVEEDVEEDDLLSDVNEDGILFAADDGAEDLQSILDRAIEIHVGDTLNADWAQDTGYYYRFTPDKDGQYAFYSQGTLDTEATLYELLDENDYDIHLGDDTENFYLRYQMTAGTTYILWAKCSGFYNEDHTSTVTLETSEDVIVTWHKNYNGSEEQYPENHGPGYTYYRAFITDKWDNDEDVNGLLPDGFFVGSPDGELVTIEDIHAGFKVHESVDLYLHWTGAIPVTWDLQGGFYYDDGIQITGNVTSKAIPGQEFETPGRPEYPGGTKEFAGWSMTPGGEVWIEEDDYSGTAPDDVSELTLYAVYTDWITVTFDGGEGAQQIVGYNDNYDPIYEENTIYEENYLSGDGIYLRADYFHKEGYAITGWALDGDPETIYPVGASQTFEQSVTLHAVWGKTYTVTFYAVGEGAELVSSEYSYDGEGIYFEGNPMTVSLAVGQTCRPYVGRRSGYAFIGWSSTPGGEVVLEPGEKFMLEEEGDVSFYTAWTEAFTFRLHANGGRFIFDCEDPTLLEKAVAKGSRVTTDTLPQPVVDAGSYFIGWATDQAGENIKLRTEIDEDGNLPFIIAKEDLELYAVWDEGIIVTLDPNGGYWDGNEWDTDPMRINFPTGGEFNVDHVDKPEGNGDFIGWALDKDGEEIVVDVLGKEDSVETFNVTEAMTLYAVWGGCKHTNLSHVEAKNAACTEDGNIEYYECLNCGKFFRDSEGTDELDSSDIIIPKKGILDIYKNAVEVIPGREYTDINAMYKLRINREGEFIFYVDTDIASLDIPTYTDLTDTFWEGATNFEAGDEYFFKYYSEGNNNIAADGYTYFNFERGDEDYTTFSFRAYPEIRINAPDDVINTGGASEDIDAVYGSTKTFIVDAYVPRGDIRYEWGIKDWSSATSQGEYEPLGDDTGTNTYTLENIRASYTELVCRMMVLSDDGIPMEETVKDYNFCIHVVNGDPGEDDTEWGIFTGTINTSDEVAPGNKVTFTVEVNNMMGKAAHPVVNVLYYQEKYSETYPGVEFGTITGDGYSADEGKLSLAANGTSTLTLTGTIPATWNDNSQILLVFLDYENDKGGQIEYPSENGQVFHSVTYDFVSSTGEALPDALWMLLPETEYYLSGSWVELTVPPSEKVDGGDAYWIFAGYDKEDFVMGTSNVTVTGTWTRREKTATEAAADTLISITDGDTDNVDVNQLTDILENVDSAEVLDQLVENLLEVTDGSNDAVNEMLAEITSTLDQQLVDDPSSTDASKKITVGNVGAYVGSTAKANVGGIQVEMTGAAATVASVIRTTDKLQENDGYHYQAEVAMEDAGLAMTLINNKTGESVLLSNRWTSISTKEAGYTATNTAINTSFQWYGGDQALTLKNVLVNSNNYSAFIEAVCDYDDPDNTKVHKLVLDGVNTLNTGLRIDNSYNSSDSDCSLIVSALSGGKLDITSGGIYLGTNATMTIESGEVSVDYLSLDNDGCSVILSGDAKLRVRGGGYDSLVKAADGYALSSTTDGDYTVYTVTAVN